MAIMRVISVAILFAPLLTACSQSVTVPTAPSVVPIPRVTPRPIPPVQPRPAANWRDSPATPGNWRWSIAEGRSAAQFGNGATVFSITCQSRSGIIIKRHGTVPTNWMSGPPAITIATTSQTKALIGRIEGDGIVVQFNPSDPLLDAIAFSRGRFAVEVEGLLPISVPSWPEIGRVIEDCR